MLTRISALIRRKIRLEETLIHKIRHMESIPLDFIVERAFLDTSDPVFLLQHLPWVKPSLFTECSTNKLINFPITRLSGITEGKKEHGIEYPTFYQYSLKLKNDYKEGNLIGFESKTDFDTNTNYVRENSQHISDNRDGIFTLFYITWSDRYYLNNIDGAHHLAAIYRQCKEQKFQFRVPCKIVDIYPHKSNLALLTNKPRIIVHQRTALNLSLLVRHTFKSGYENVSYHHIGYSRALLNFQCNVWIQQAIVANLRQYHGSRNIYDISPI